MSRPKLATFSLTLNEQSNVFKIGVFLQGNRLTQPELITYFAAQLRSEPWYRSVIPAPGVIPIQSNGNWLFIDARHDPTMLPGAFSKIMEILRTKFDPEGTFDYLLPSEIYLSPDKWSPSGDIRSDSDILAAVTDILRYVPNHRL